MKGFDAVLVLTFALFAGFLAGAHLEQFAMERATPTEAVEIKNLVRECEATLPRNMTCELIAVPNTKETNEKS